MLFHQNDFDEKGLFTFYFEQLSEEHTIKQRKDAKKMKEGQQSENDLPHNNVQKPIKRRETIRESIEQKLSQIVEERQHHLKGKLSQSKQRLRESIIEMGKDNGLNHPQSTYKQHLNPIRFRQFSVNPRRSNAHPKDGHLNICTSQQNVHYQHEHTIESFNLNSLKRHKLTQKVASSNIKGVVQSSRDMTLELPEIRRAEELKRTSRPKKSMRSQLIQEALHTGDRVKIKRIREYLRGESPLKPLRNSQLTKIEEENEQRSMKVFQFRQQKLLEILQRFRRQ